MNNLKKIEEAIKAAGLWAPVEIGDGLSIQWYGRCHWSGYLCALVIEGERRWAIEQDLGVDRMSKAVESIAQDVRRSKYITEGKHNIELVEELSA